MPLVLWIVPISLRATVATPRVLDLPAIVCRDLATGWSRKANLRALFDRFMVSRLAQEEVRRRLISFGVVGCTSVRVFGKFPLRSQWRIHLDPLRQPIRVFGKFPLMSQWRIHLDQHLDLLRQNYLVFLVVRSSVSLARRCRCEDRCWCGDLCRTALPATCNRDWCNQEPCTKD